MRKFIATVENGIGDRAEVCLNVREDRQPSQYTGPAILKAMRVLPDEKPWRVVAMDEQVQ